MISSRGYAPSQPAMQRKVDADDDDGDRNMQLQCSAPACRGPPVIHFPVAKMSTKPPRKSKATALEVHKFGGASLADAAAYRHAAQIVKGRGAPCVVVVSAPAGVTDALLGLARRAAAGEQQGLERDTEALRARYRDIARAAVGSESAAAEVVAEIAASLAELSRLLSSPV